MKLKEVFAVLFIAGIIITVLPDAVAIKYGIAAFRDAYQTYISIAVIVIAAFYLLNIITWIFNKVYFKCFGPEHIGKKYLKEIMSPDEMGFLVEKFYDQENRVFRNTGYIDINDGRGAGLKNRHVIYISANASYYNSFAHNLQPWAYRFLNENLAKGNIKIQGQHIEFKLK